MRLRKETQAVLWSRRLNLDSLTAEAKRSIGSTSEDGPVRKIVEVRVSTGSQGRWTRYSGHFKAGNKRTPRKKTNGHRCNDVQVGDPENRLPMATTRTSWYLRGVIAAAGCDIEVLGDRGSRSVGAALTADLAGARTASIAVAFAKQSALRHLDLPAFCADGRDLRLVAGTDFALTELALLGRLSGYPSASCRVFHTLAANRVFHPKLYVLDEDERRVAYIGSANLTAGGLERNYESVVRMVGPRDHPAMAAPSAMFEAYFASEFASPLTPEFERRYQELRQAHARADAERWRLPEAMHAVVEDRLALAEYRAEAAVRRWLLVTTPENYVVCLDRRVWGRQQRAEIEGYRPGDPFFFHVAKHSEVRALGMFVDRPFFDASPLWPAAKAGDFPWRIRFELLGELRTGLPTRALLEARRLDAPRHWFNGFIQKSHALDPEDFAVLSRAFHYRMRAESTAQLPP